ncbi:hypothetical protein [Hoeflea sp.]|uniref:hypothetical protein n=1 Tax=Hoeflea sp. TaxID=1940281 RepID=UPI0019AFE829|nr:hypothetical protein [Hoeflea sp.]MBC7282627.1 hypothetical protein [Hoeflea sp.]
MREKKKPYVWASEAALCDEFARLIPDGWTLYNETCGFDMVLVHDATGAQIGIEAKLTLNAKVICQAIDGSDRRTGPDFRAVLVGRVGGDLMPVARALGVTVIRLREKAARWRHWGWQGPERPTFQIVPDLPSGLDRVEIVTDYAWMDREDWHDLAPEARLDLPEYVPDVGAGRAAPMMLSPWKIKAIKVCVYVERHGRINRATFRALGISASRWTNGFWMKPADRRGFWVPGRGFPAAAYRKQHPNIYERIAAEYDAWAVAAKIEAPEVEKELS